MRIQRELSLHGVQQPPADSAAQRKGHTELTRRRGQTLPAAGGSGGEHAASEAVAAPQGRSSGTGAPEQGPGPAREADRKEAPADARGLPAEPAPAAPAAVPAAAAAGPVEHARAEAGDLSAAVREGEGAGTGACAGSGQRAETAGGGAAGAQGGIEAAGAGDEDGGREGGGKDRRTAVRGAGDESGGAGDEGGELRVPGDYGTLAEAVAAARAGQTIRVCGEVEVGGGGDSVVVGKGLRIVGDGGAVVRAGLTLENRGKAAGVVSGLVLRPRVGNGVTVVVGAWRVAGCVVHAVATSSAIQALPPHTHIAPFHPPPCLPPIPPARTEHMNTVPPYILELQPGRFQARGRWWGAKRRAGRRGVEGLDCGRVVTGMCVRERDRNEREPV